LEDIKHGPTGISTWYIAFFYFILMTYQRTINDNVEIVLFVDDTSIIITSLNSMNFESSVNKVFQDINKRFTTNLLSLDVNKTIYVIYN
jgi:hypothetical protein